MQISANDIRAGNILEHNNDLWVVSKTPVHTKPGKGGAYVQVEMKNLKTGNKTNIRFSSSEHVQKAQLEQGKYEFLYKESDSLVFMNKDNYEQINIPEKMFGDKLPFLQDNMVVEIEFYKEQPMHINLPMTVILEITDTDPVMKNSTVTGSFKPATLSNGLKVKVPPYLSNGEKIVVKTEDLSFVERAK